MNVFIPQQRPAIPFSLAEFRSAFYNQAMRYLLLALLMSLIVLAAACAPVSTPVAPLPSPTLAATPAPVTTAAPATLTLWLPDWMALKDRPGHDKLAEAIAAFEAEAGVQVTIIPKLPRGSGGMLDSLRITKPVAASVLPDIVALPYQDIPAAAQNDLLQPLETILPPALQNNHYLFAQQASLVDDVWMAVPFTADFEHLAFQPAALSEPPVNWSIVLDSQSRYAFPAGGPEATWTDAILVHYLSVVPAGASPLRNQNALKSLLDFYEQLRKKRLIDDASLQAKGPEDTWSRALQGNTPLADTTSSLWLTQRDKTTVLRSGPIPTHDGQARYVIHGWAYAIITADPNQQNLAAQLISRLTAAETLSAWSQASYVLPARGDSLALWADDEYRAFVTEALEQGFLMPDFTQDSEMARSVHQAAAAVLSGQMSAEDAWNQAIANW